MRDGIYACADPEGGTGDPDPPEKSQNIGFHINTGLDFLKKAQGYSASIRCWAIIGTPAKRHLKAFRWRADDGPV